VTNANLEGSSRLLLYAADVQIVAGHSYIISHTIVLFLAHRHSNAVFSLPHSTRFLKGTLV